MLQTVRIGFFALFIDYRYDILSVFSHACEGSEGFAIYATFLLLKYCLMFM